MFGVPDIRPAFANPPAHSIPTKGPTRVSPSGTDGLNPVSSTGESANHLSGDRHPRRPPGTEIEGRGSTLSRHSARGIECPVRNFFQSVNHLTPIAGSPHLICQLKGEPW